MIEDQRVEAAVMFIRKEAANYAKGKAVRVQLEQFLKSKKAILMQQAEKAGHKTTAAQEREAYAHPDYVELLEALQVAVEREETIRWEMVSAELTVDVWRTQQASARRLDRSAA